MLARAAPSTCIPTRITRAPVSSFLPFLYCTQTVLRPYQSQSNDYAPRNKAPRNSPKPEKDGGDGEEFGGWSEDWNKKRTVRPNRQGHASVKQRKTRFGRDGFKVNDTLDTVLKTVKPRPPPYSDPSEKEGEDNSYSPFAGWSGPSSADVKEKTPKRVHRDASQVPFERPQHQAQADSYADLEGTTITPNERKAFQALFEMKKSPSDPEPASASVAWAKDTIRKEFETMKPDGSDKQPEGPTRLHRPPSEFPEPLKKLRESVGSKVQDTPLRPSKRRVIELTVGDHRSRRDRRWADQDLFDVRSLMRHATTDVEVWNILHSRVLDRVLALELDGLRSPPKGKKKRKAIKAAEIEQVSTTDVKTESKAVSQHQLGSQNGMSPMVEEPSEVVDTLLPTAQDGTTEADLAPFEERTTDTMLSTHPQPTPQSMADISLRHHRHAFPQHLRNTFKHLTRNFHGSPLPLNIIPLVKSLGPSTATLGLSTDLYNMHLQHHWSKYRDPLSIDAILREMEDNVYEFDGATRSIVLEIIRAIKSARFGRLGTVAQVLGSMERTSTGLKRLSGWYGVMKKRSEDEALRKAQEREALEMEERQENERALEREGLREAMNGTEHDDADLAALDEMSDDHVAEESEQATAPASSPAI